MWRFMVTKNACVWLVVLLTLLVPLREAPGTTVFYDGFEGADLELANLTVLPSTVGSERAFTACSFDIINHGPTVLSSEYIMVDYYLSSNTTCGDGDDVKIGDTGFTLSISSGGTVSIPLSPTGLGYMVRYWLASQPCGNYYVLARVSISNPPPSDPNPENNCDRTNSTIS